MKCAERNKERETERREGGGVGGLTGDALSHDVCHLAAGRQHPHAQLVHDQSLQDGSAARHSASIHFHRHLLQQCVQILYVSFTPNFVFGIHAADQRHSATLD